MALDLHRKYIEKKQESAPLVPIKDIVNSKYYVDPLELLGERSFNEPREIDESEVGSPIQEFYRGAVIFLTGGTGFMGKVLIEKLLRACPHIKHIYLLIRSKKGKNVEQRLEDIFEDRVSVRLRLLRPLAYVSSLPQHRYDQVDQAKKKKKSVKLRSWKFFYIREQY